jgi:hypothetical protein
MDANHGFRENILWANSKLFHQIFQSHMRIGFAFIRGEIFRNLARNLPSLIALVCIGILAYEPFIGDPVPCCFLF